MSTGRGGQPQRPVIVVLAAGAEQTVRAVLAGIEEEGVPSVAESVADSDRGAAAAHLAMRAAAQSPLQVGVGIGGDASVSVCHAKLADPVFELAPGSATGAARTVGHNAARIVTGLPLKAHVGLDSAAMTDDTAIKGWVSDL